MTKKPQNPTGDMTLVEHLKELRRRVIIALIAFAIGTIIGFIWYGTSPSPIPTLGDILRGPYCSLPADKRAAFTLDGECRLIATMPFEAFSLRLKIGSLAGAVLSSPIWLYQLWAFITPGLHKNEKRTTTIFVTIAVTLFTAGATLAYFVVHYGLEFLLTIGGEFQVTALSGERYFNFLLALLIIFGVSFEVPLVIAMLNIVGILPYDMVKNKRRLIIVILFIFAAIMTPGQDPYSMLALALALTLLVELSLQFTRINDKRRGRNRPDWLNTDDEHASPLTTPTKPPNPQLTQKQPINNPTNFDDII